MTRWRIRLSRTARVELAKLDRPIRARIVAKLEEIADGDPRQSGKALTGNLAGLWRYRVGSYWIICQIQDQELVILGLQIGHRSTIYKN
ncbi:type II toxin-antitoxin system RelE/ParE family toxin [Gleimia hominis]|uniref:Type II toxin-antitoxin system RelE/ParE family toxin n=1 Tax=Gleimia hominis TaxID=595468 RepID=A0ABU3IA47_9ACTO|nr:type II toxin-antitoxin system RelE/ParE family toxin [Gleimia hominis]MDT3767254.1 type II toxin-antitoxin system RelE/ParE family toxin [Gleimia hominis]